MCRLKCRLTCHGVSHEDVVLIALCAALESRYCCLKNCTRSPCYGGAASLAGCIMAQVVALSVGGSCAFGFSSKVQRLSHSLHCRLYIAPPPP